MSQEFDTKRNLIVNYLPSNFSQDDVRDLFARIGEVRNCKLVRNNATQQSLGYAFIEYAEEESAAQAISQITGMEMQGKTIKVSYARQSSPEIKNSNVYIGSLPQWVTEDKLLSLFSPFGSVLSHKILSNPDGSSRGAGFVRFSLNTEASEAIAGMAGKTLPDAEGPLTVKLAIPPASKRDSLQALNAITSSNLVGVGVASRTANVRFNPMAPSNQMLLNPGLQQQVNSTPQAAVAAARALQMQNNLAISGNGQATSVYCFGLQPTHTELTLYELFSPFGAILNVKLIRDNSDELKPCKGYGFVNFTNQEDGLRAISTMNGVPFEDKVLQVSLKQSKLTQANNYSKLIPKQLQQQANYSNNLTQFNPMASVGQIGQLGNYGGYTLAS